MAIVINAKGTSVPYFKIGKSGNTIYQGSSDPNGTYTLFNGDYWLDSADNSIRVWESSSSSWRTPITRLNISLISGNTTATISSEYVFTASLTLTLPASPSIGDWVKTIDQSGTTTCIIARNGSNIMSLAQDVTLDNPGSRLTIIYSGATKGWVLY